MALMGRMPLPSKFTWSTQLNVPMLKPQLQPGENRSAIVVACQDCLLLARLSSHRAPNAGVYTTPSLDNSWTHGSQLHNVAAKAQQHFGSEMTIPCCLQHFPVYTLGKRGQDKDFLVPEEELRRKGAEVFRVGRGGETTFHGPRQLVGYPIVNLRRLGKGARAYVEALEDTVVCTLQKFGIDAQVRCSSSSLMLFL